MKKRIIASVAIAAVAALTVAGCTSASSKSTNATGQTLTVSVPYDNNSFDSADLQGGMELFWGPVYDTLLKHSAKNGDVVGNAATSYSYNSAKTQLTLSLRQGMKFSDGTPVNSTAVKDSMERLKDGTGASAGYLASVSKIETPSTTTVKLDLTAPDPVLLDYLTAAAGAIANPKAFSNKNFSRVPAGSGPYVLDSAKSTQGVQYTFTKNMKYWDAKSYPYTTMVTKVISDQTARINALISGQLDYGVIDTSSIAQAKASNLTVQTVLTGWVGMAISDRAGTLSAPLKDVRVRQAINYAFNRDEIVKKFYAGVGKATDSTFDSTSGLYSKSNESLYSYDPAKAKQLLAAAGYPNGFSITLPTSPRSANLDATIQQSLGNIGIKVTYKEYTDEQITPVLLAAKYPMYWFSDESQSAFYDIKKSVLPTAVWNPFHTTDPTVEALAKKAQYATSDSVANAAYKELGTYLIKQGWWVPFTELPNNFVTDSKTVFTPTPTDPQIFPRNFKPAK